VQHPNQYKSELNKLFQYTEKLFRQLPVSLKEKRVWLSKRRSEKVFSLAIFQNEKLKNIVVSDKKFFISEQQLPVTKEAQQFESLLTNLEHYLKTQNEGFVNFIYQGKKQNETSRTGTLDLFSHLQVSADSTGSLAKEKESKLKKLDEHAKTYTGDFYSVIDNALLVYNELNNEKGFKKYSCLYPDYILNGKGSLFNFTKILQKKELKGKESKSSFKQVQNKDLQLNFQNWEELAIDELNSVISELRDLYKNAVNFEQLSVKDKIRLNYLFDNAFEIPEIDNLGFDYNHPAVVELCSKGKLDISNTKIEGIGLISELLESKGFLTKAESNKNEYQIDLTYGSGRLILSKYNNMFASTSKSETKKAGQTKAVIYSDGMLSDKLVSVSKF
jgi:hypothetical protein